jgi:hypothetical protein
VKYSAVKVLQGCWAGLVDASCAGQCYELNECQSHHAVMVCFSFEFEEAVRPAKGHASDSYIVAARYHAYMYRTASA